MKVALYGLLIVFCIAGCKKTIEKAQEAAAIDAITSGYWIVTKYQKGSTDISNSFSSYKFQFKENYTVDAIRNNVFEISGHWEADANSRTIDANFPNVSTPLSLLNGRWTITNSTWTSVDATITVDGEKRELHLSKE
jgi:hypothetical protein